MARSKSTDTEEEVAITVRFPRSVRDDATELAKADDRSLNLYIVRAVKAQVERDSDKKKGGR